MTNAVRGTSFTRFQRFGKVGGLHIVERVPIDLGFDPPTSVLRPHSMRRLLGVRLVLVRDR